MEQRHREDQARLKAAAEEQWETESRARRQAELSRRVKAMLPKYVEPCDLDSYLIRFEQILTVEGVPRAEWNTYLLSSLNGKAATVLTSAIPENARHSYAASKAALLETLGLTSLQYEDLYFSATKAWTTSPEDHVTKSDAVVTNLFAASKSKIEMVWAATKMHALRGYSEECRKAVRKENPTNKSELIIAIREYERMYGNSTRPKPRLPRSQEYGRRSYDRNYDRGEDRYDRRYPAKQQEYSNYSGGRRDTSPSWEKKPYQDKSNTFSAPRDTYCFKCKDPDHLANACPLLSKYPKKVKSEPVNTVQVSNRATSNAVVWGMVQGRKATILMDTGARISMIRKSLVKPEDYLNEEVNIVGWNGQTPTTLPVAEISVTIESATAHRVAAVAPDELLDTDVIECDISDLSLQDLMRIKYYDGPSDKKVGVTTRAATLKEEETAKQTAAQEELDRLEPKNPESFQQEAVDQLPQITDATVEPDSPGETPREKFLAAVLADDTLAEWRSKANHEENGFHWNKDALSLTTMDELGSPKTLIAIPQTERPNLIRLAHDLNGHLGAKKVQAILQQTACWPGLHSDVLDWCKRCIKCQEQRKHQVTKAPMVAVPLVTIPFEKIAIDLVGPFPRTKSGYRFLLTTIDLATRYPEAIPLKSATAEEVAEGMMDIFSRHGLPRMIQSDQGTQLCGKVMTQLCNRMGIEKVRTTPYHPEANGCVERLHGTLVPMLRKAISNKIDWAMQTKLCLFAIRAATNRSTGFSPAELMYGHTIRTPVDLQTDQWLAQELPPFNVTLWMEHLTARLESLQQACLDNGLVAQSKSKADFDRKARLRQTAVGDKVLLRSPGLASKLESAWSGPYTITKLIGPVNVEIVKADAPRRKRIVHLNLTKPFFIEECKVLRLMVVSDETEPEKPTTNLAGDQTTPEQELELQEIIHSAPHIFTNSPGKTSLACHSIDIEPSCIKPIRSCPYSISPAKRAGVIKELRELIAMGILVPSTSPWASSLVPVMKPDGSVRVCIDYRALNAVTVCDPYHMPLIEDIINRVGNAVFLTKMDLSKGFYQVPIPEADQPKTAILTPIGKFNFTRMPFGLRNAPTTFQRLMDTVLQNMEDFAAPYIDDIIIFSSSWKEHISHIHKVLDRISEAGLTVKLAKCAWGKKTLEHLGQVVGNGLVSVSDTKVQSLRDYKRPDTQKTLKAFLGLAGYYRKFISHFASYSAVLNAALKKANPAHIDWTPERLDAFHHLRATLSHMCTLNVVTDQDHLTLQTDASYAGLGGCLSAKRNDQLVPVAFYSRQLTPAESNYTVTELECLAVVAGVKHFETYLDGKQFEIQTDHKALQYLQTANLKNRRLTRWALQLQGFTFSISYRPGKDNANADGMSRQAWDLPEQEATDSTSQMPRTTSIIGGGDVGPAFTEEQTPP